MRSQIRAVLFDAYGTLFDVHSVVTACETAFPGKGTALSQLWRSKQLEYSWLRGLGERYVSFWQITQDALDYATHALQLQSSPQIRASILDAYFHLSAYPEVHEVLDALRARGLALGTLSNGSPEMLDAVLASSGVAGKLDHVLSVDRARSFKPDPRVYALGAQACGVPAAQILFVSSNAWDIAGAGWNGYLPFWVNRSGAPADRLEMAHADHGENLRALLAYFGS